MGLDDFCNTGLVLGLGFSSPSEIAVPLKKHHKEHNNNQQAGLGILEPSLLSLSLPCETTYHDHRLRRQEVVVKKVVDLTSSYNNKAAGCGKVQSADLYRQDSAASSFSNISVKREREFGSEEGETTERGVSSKISDEDDDGSNGRKKLRLSKAQSALLEECFKQHNTLNPKQKQELARELKLRPRQVEVWFQNRRARTKLKQTEVDCEILKKCCDNLTDENRRLQKELQELKAVKLAQPLYMQLPAATLTMCPSCERIGTGGDSNNNTSKNSLISSTLGSKSHIYNPFPNPSAAC